MEIEETAKDGNKNITIAKRDDIVGETEGFGSANTGPQKREGGDLIQAYKLINGVDVIDDKKLLLRDEVTSRSIRCQSKKFRMGRCFKDMKIHLSTKKYGGME